MPDKPVIGVTVAHCSEELDTFPRYFYVEMVKEVGGIPVILPPVATCDEAKNILEITDGLLLSGGGDLSPIYLGEVPLRGIGKSIPERDLGELLLTKLALERDMPVLGICRGIQVLAVAAGGRIYQDIVSQRRDSIEHKQLVSRQHVWHEVEIFESKLLQIVANKYIKVNSLHHQAVSVVPSGFKYNALAPDGIIEGIEKDGASFCIGVQWHPEVLQSEMHAKKLFKAFIDTCHKK